jgi:hypothetical protein
MADVLSRFAAKRRIDPTSRCWLWDGCLDRDGYGLFWMNGRNARAHRAAFELFVRPLRRDELCLHDCDNPRCCNPEHLSAGTQRDNIRDCLRKGRRDAVRPPLLRGERNNHAKLTEIQVREIRDRFRPHVVTQQMLAHDYGVVTGTIKQIVQRRTWAWLH